ncbi:hypothetical protein EPN29_03565 [bacterium]|nr:MAG: hypothetical protein EPN29_03565 [bacterium]
MPARTRSQTGQVMVLVAVALLALIGSAALVLLAGSAEWQKNQLQQLADQSALDSALKIGTGCDAARANAVITEADSFLAAQRTRTGSLAITAGTCAVPYQGTDSFAGGLSATINYPYRAHQQQVEVILTLKLPISFGGEVGATSTSVVRRAVAQQLAGSVPAVTATSLACTGGQVNISGSVATRNAIARGGACALYAHARFDAPSGTYSDLGNVRVFADGQTWVGGGGGCTAGANAGSSSAICADGFELSGHVAPACGTGGTSEYLSAADALINPNPCAAGVAPQPVAPPSSTLPPEPNTDASAVATLKGTGGAACSPGAVYPKVKIKGKNVYSGLAPPPTQDGNSVWHFVPSCYGYIDVGLVKPDGAVLDPGFYYFNGSNSGGGGGICVNGGALYARDVTLEFVNQAGFSSGDCTVGGGGGCAAPCQVGSAPCSLRPCPPNTPADAPNNLTWFAAPCAGAPSALDAASCPVSAWCPVGDRSCWNLLVWAPAGTTGQFTLKGAAVNAWLLGSVYWPGTCTDDVNGTSTIAGAISCTSLSISAGAGAATAIGGDYGINTASAEAILIE